MQNKSLRNIIHFMSNDAKKLLEAFPDGEGLDSLEIVERHEEEIVSYIESLERRKVGAITVYVAGPIAIGDQIANCGRAIRFGHELHLRGFVPFVPHWAIAQQLYQPWTPAEWLEYDFVWLDKCDVVFRLVGESLGSDQEVSRAKNLGIPVFYENTDGLNLLEAYRKMKRL